MKRKVTAALTALAGMVSAGGCLARGAVAHRVLAADRGVVAIFDRKGAVTWEAPDNTTCHDLAMLPNGNILMPTSATRIVEMTPDKKVVWEHVSHPAPGNTGSVEIHAFQRLPDGLTMVAEAGNHRIIEVDANDRIVHEMPLTLDHPNSHRDTRLVRKLRNGHYLVCHEGDGVVREYDPSGKVVWSYALDLNGRPETPGHEGHGTNVFGAIRMSNGDTMIATGNGNRVIEVTPAGKIDWSIEQDELPGIKLFWVTTLELLPNGDLVIGNCHAGPDNPQLIEVTREKKVVWTFKNWSVLGNEVAAAQVLDVKGRVIR